MILRFYLFSTFFILISSSCINYTIRDDFYTNKYPISMTNYLYDENFGILSEKDFLILEHYIYIPHDKIMLFGNYSFNYTDLLEEKIQNLGGEGGINFRLIEPTGFEVDIIKRK